LIQAVYILIADSGLCVLDRKYGEADMDPNLISGFLTALIQFGRELSDGNRVHVIDFGAFDICLSLKDNVIVAAIVDKVDDGNAAMAVLTDVNNAFTKKYGNMLQEWDGNLEPFEEFYKQLDEITKNGCASETKIVVPVLKGKVNPMLVRLGQMSQLTFDVAKKCDGKLTTRDIADQIGMHLKEVQKSLNTLEDMKLLEWKEIG
jgi:nucleoid DNA-binding protein